VATTSPARIDDDLYASAKLVGEVQSRSASQQVVHWARIGREIEASTAISYKEIAEVLGGSRSYDALGPRDQAIVRAEWSAKMETLRRDLNFAQKFAASGRTWVELDDDGNVVARDAVRGEDVAAEHVIEKGPSRTRGGTSSRRASKSSADGKLVNKKAPTGNVVARTGTTAARGAATKPAKGSGKAAGVRSAR
jgi:hypothetical protein